MIIMTKTIDDNLIGRKVMMLFSLIKATLLDFNEILVIVSSTAVNDLDRFNLIGLMFPGK